MRIMFKNNFKLNNPSSFIYTSTHISNTNSLIYRILEETTHIVSKYQKEEIKGSILNILTNNTPASNTYTHTSNPYI